MMKKIIFVFAFFGFFMLLPYIAEARETFNPYISPDIKKNYCGPVMDYRYCKCAFHSDEQHCKAVGTTPGEANNYVQSGFSTWKAKVEWDARDNCKTSQGVWITRGGKSGCLVCHSGYYLIEDKCKSVQELCSADPNVRYDKDKKQCFCPEGFELIAEKSCESICGEDPNIYFDAESKSCLCQPGFKYVKDEMACEEVEEIELIVEEVGEKKAPFLGDGETIGKFKIKVIYSENGKPANLTFKLHYTTMGKSGKIVSVEGDKNEYLLTYRAANLKDQKPGIGKDVLYIFYHSPIAEQEIYKTYDISVFNALSVEAKVRKFGFTEILVTIPFISDRAEVFVYTEGENKEKIPVTNAEISYEGYWTEYTDKDGMAKVEAPTDVEGTKEETIVETFLILTDELKKRRDGALERYSVLGGYQLENETIKDFIRNFNKYLAQTKSETEAKKAAAGLKQVDYALFFLKQGSKIGDDAAKSLSETISGAIWDLLDALNLFDKLKGPLTDFINKKTGGINFQASHEVTDAFKRNLAEDTLENIEKMPNVIMRSFFTGIRVLALSGTTEGKKLFGMSWKFTPLWFDGIFKEILDADAQKGINWLGDKLSFKNWLTNKFKDLNKEAQEGVLLDLASKVKQNDFNEYSDAALEGAKESYVNFSDWYIKQHNADYNATMIKQYSELGINIVGKALKVMYPATAGKIVELMENIYKATRSGIINNVQLSIWFDIYTKNHEMMLKNVTRAFTSAPNNSELAFAKPVFVESIFAAKEVDVLHNLFLSNLNKDSDEYKNTIAYLEAEIDYEAYGIMASLTELLAQAEPDDKELQELNSHIVSERDKSKIAYEEKKTIVDKLGLFDPNYGKKQNKWILLTIAVLIIAVVVFACRKLYSIIRRRA